MKRALVTGASGAIGSAICRRLAEADMQIIVHCNRNAEARITSYNVCYTKLLRDIPRAGSGQELQHWVQRYAERLEHYCRVAPYNWFNFYDFWAAAAP